MDISPQIYSSERVAVSLPWHELPEYELSDTAFSQSHPYSTSTPYTHPDTHSNLAQPIHPANYFQFRPQAAPNTVTNSARSQRHVDPQSPFSHPDNPFHLGLALELPKSTHRHAHNQIQGQRGPQLQTQTQPQPFPARHGNGHGPSPKPRLRAGSRSRLCKSAAAVAAPGTTIPVPISDSDSASVSVPVPVPLQTPESLAVSNSMPTQTSISALNSHAHTRTQPPLANEVTLPLEIRCYEHGCAGRRFSSLGNYRRHIREKNGVAQVHPCPDCGRVFTRSTARNFHRESGTCGLSRSLVLQMQMQMHAQFYGHGYSQGPSQAQVASAAPLLCDPQPLGADCSASWSAGWEHNQIELDRDLGIGSDSVGLGLGLGLGPVPGAGGWGGGGSSGPNGR
ncbi:hypothetical protein BJY04DRAFT_218869 [Aspergillus karnatakaensis]|uniref:uncharacterized protein n=1 Tax=Aspergillus karnatakaensis TaxID=1810916 RepID=UPI003CCE1E2D